MAQFPIMSASQHLKCHPQMPPRKTQSHSDAETTSHFLKKGYYRKPKTGYTRSNQVSKHIPW